MVTLILGYNIFQKRKRLYKNYLDTSLRWISETKSDCIIISGGASNKNYLNLSEARSIRNYLVEQNPELKGKIVLEERSLTTLQNIAFCRDLMVQKKLAPTAIQVICDSIRVPKVFYLAMMYFNHILNLNATEQEIYNQFLQQQKRKTDITKDVTFIYNNLSVRGFSFHRNRKDIGAQILASILEIGEYRFPEIEKGYVKWRKEDFGLMQ